MEHDSPARLHLPRIHGHIDLLTLGFWVVYLSMIIVAAKLILNTLP